MWLLYMKDTQAFNVRQGAWMPASGHVGGILPRVFRNNGGGKTKPNEIGQSIA